MNKAKTSPWYQQLTVLLILLGIFLLAERQLNTWLGKRAQENAGLEPHRLEQAMALAKQTGKPVFAEFSAIWCPACRRLNNDVLSDDSIKRLLNEEYHFARLEYEDDKDRSWFEHYGVIGFPTLLVLSGEGQLIKPLPLPRSPAELQQSLAASGT